MKVPTKKEIRQLNRQEQLELIKYLAREHFIEQKIGTSANFEQMWGEAFHVSGPLVLLNPKGLNPPNPRSGSSDKSQIGIHSPPLKNRF